MDQLKKMIADTQKKIDQANPNFCGTPDMIPTELTKQMAKTLLMGKGNVDDLLNSPGKKLDKKFKNKRVCT